MIRENQHLILLRIGLSIILMKKTITFLNKKNQKKNNKLHFIYIIYFFSFSFYLFLFNLLLVMGNPFSYIRSLFGKKEVKILMLGLDAAGKTTIIF